jgi:hypothetical protein
MLVWRFSGEVARIEDYHPGLRTAINKKIGMRSVSPVPAIAFYYSGTCP